jgi:gas vesicle protein
MSRDPEEIREDIERTRGNLSEDVDAIADRVSPSSIAHRQSERVKGSVRRAKDAVMGSVESAGAEASDKMHDAPGAVVSQTRGHPLAAGLIAFGAGLLASSLIPGSEKEREMVHTLKDKAEPVTTELTEAAKDIAEDLKEPAAAAVETIKASARESAETVKSEATDEAGHLQDQASDAAANVQEPGGSTGPTTASGAPQNYPPVRPGGI